MPRAGWGAGRGTGQGAGLWAPGAVMLASGFAGLGYQIVWTQQGALWLGHEAAAVLAVVAAFFGGLAVGALALGPRAARSARPERWYAGLEAAIALWSVVLAFGLGPASAALLALTGPQPGAAWQWAVAFAGTFVLLLPATAAMGATLPAMAAALARAGHAPATLAGLYACNTFGAVLGVLATAFWLVPAIGLLKTAALCALVNGVCALAALALRRAGAARETAPAPATELATVPAPAAAATLAAVPGPMPAPSSPQRTLALLFATGTLGIGFEVLVVRVLGQVTEQTVYTFALLLAVYLVGSAAGAAAWQRWVAPRGDTGVWQDRLLAALAGACVLGTASLWGAEALRAAVQLALSPGVASALAAEAALALAAFALPTFCMGALFSHLATQVLAQGGSLGGKPGLGLGRALGVNTLGAALAPPLFGVLAVPLVGAKAALLAVAVGYLLLVSSARWRRPGPWVPAAAVAALAAFAPPLVFVQVPEGGRVVDYREGALAAVSVVADAEGTLRLRIDNRQQEGSSATQLADARQALLPLLLHPAPQRALFLGLGTGVTASAAAADPTLQVDAAELLPEVIEAAALFIVPGSEAAPRPQAVAADARRFVRTATARYDLIVADNFHPARSGAGTLYTVEHFAAVRARLQTEGLFCQWLPLHQLDLATLRSILRSYLAVFPAGAALLATNSLETPVLGLLSRADDGRIDLARLQQRLAANRLPQRLPDYGLPDAYAVLGSFVAGPQALARFAGDAPPNTDDRPVVVYGAPAITYAPDSLPRDRLLALLPQLGVQTGEVIDTGSDAAAAPRLAAYRAARDAFLRAGRDVRPAADARAMLAQVRGPLLAVLRTSPDFTPAYDPLLRLAAAVAASDAATARDVLGELVRLQPARPEAAQLLARLGAPPR